MSVRGFFCVAVACALSAGTAFAADSDRAPAEPQQRRTYATTEAERVRDLGDLLGFEKVDAKAETPAASRTQTRKPRANSRLKRIETTAKPMISPEVAQADRLAFY
jgi:hypothetical protein